MPDKDSVGKENETCSYCGLPIEAGQESTTVNGKPMHFACYQEASGGVAAS